MKSETKTLTKQQTFYAQSEIRMLGTKATLSFCCGKKDLPFLQFFFNSVAEHDGLYSVDLFYNSELSNIKDGVAVAFKKGFNPDVLMPGVLKPYFGKFACYYKDNFGVKKVVSNEIDLRRDNTHIMKFKVANEENEYSFCVEKITDDDFKSICRTEDIFWLLDKERNAGLLIASAEEFKTSEDFLKHVNSCKRFIDEYLNGRTYYVMTKDKSAFVCESELEAYLNTLDVKKILRIESL